MPRPRKFRNIDFRPSKLHFVPCEQQGTKCSYHSVHSEYLELEELEAVRLKDYEGLEQSECAEKMQISRSTFQRILISARKKIADCLIHGKEIIINSKIDDIAINKSGQYHRGHGCHDIF